MVEELENYAHMHQQDVTMSVLAANLFSLPLAVVGLVVLLVPFGLIWGASGAVTAFEQLFSGLGGLLMLPAIVVGIVVHEALHGVGWTAFGKISWKHISFGIKSLTPFAHCSVPLSLDAYRWGTALPGLLLGIVPWLLGLAFASGAFWLWGTLFTIAAFGDLMILWLLRSTPADALILDHPSKIGCVVLFPDMEDVE